ncbi:MAG: VTT domain-containing protein [Pseudomonadota bacterium]
MDMASTATETAQTRRYRVWGAIGALALLVLVLAIGKFGGFFDPQVLGSALGESIRQFADGPFGVPALIFAFCACAFIAMPQFVLIGVAVFAFDPVMGALWAWVATLFSGSLTFWIGRFSGQDVLKRFSGARTKKFTDFIARNAFAASVFVRNVPTGPFLIVNMVFGAVRAKYLHYLAGVAVGIIPKILLVAFGLQAVQAALGGNLWLAGGTAIGAIAIFIAGRTYVKHRQKSEQNIALEDDEPVDTMQ